MKFTNNSTKAVRIAGIGWIKPGSSIEVEDQDTIKSIKGLIFFEENGGSSQPKTSKTKSVKGIK